MKIIDYKKSLVDRYRKNKRVFFFYLMLRAFVILTLVRCIFTKNYESAMICVLSLLLFLVPAFLQSKMKIEIPALFQGIIFGFIYAAEIMGEVDHYYVKVPGWDTMLHTINGFLFAAIGFSLIYLLNRGSKHFNLSPFYLTLVAFCFSMTVGVLWEFFEFTMDQFFYLDMQKDFMVQTIGSVTLDPNNGGIPFVIRDITDTVVNTADGQSYTINGGYLDIGIIDTMKDLMVNLLGAVVFSFIGYGTLKYSKRSAIAENLMIKPSDEE